VNRNPLESLGIPKYIVAGIWGDSSLTESERVARLMEIIKNAYRGLQRSLHTDVVGENPYIREITEAFEDIEPEVLPGIINRFITVSDIQREREVQEVRRQIEQATGRFKTLLPFLRLIDWRDVLGSDVPVELLFGLPENLWDTGDSFMNTYLLACTASGQGLTRLPHPDDGDALTPVIARFANVPFWEDGEWQVDDFDYSTVPATARRYRYEPPRPVGPVRLVGQVRPSVLHALAGTQGERRPAIEGGVMPLIGGGAPNSTVSDKVVWWDPAGAWWLPGLEPRLHTGNFAIIARGEGTQLRLAVAGRYLTERQLN
jgi:hypothetical protein